MNLKNFQWIMDLLKALMRGKFTGGVCIAFIDGGISYVRRHDVGINSKKKKEKEK